MDQEALEGKLKIVEMNENKYTVCQNLWDAEVIAEAYKTSF